MRQSEDLSKKKSKAAFAQKPHLLNQIWEEDTKFEPRDPHRNAHFQKARSERNGDFWSKCNHRVFFQDNAITVRKLAATILHPVD